MNTTTTTAPKSRLYSIVSIIVNAFMLMAALISFSHIITTSARLGVTSWQTYLVPLFVDGLAVLGMIGRSEAMARQLAARGLTAEQIAAVKRFAFWLQLTAGLVSLAANFYAGETLGDRLFGLLVVAGFVVTEKYSEKLRAIGAQAHEPAPQITAADMQAYADAAVSAALAQARAEFAIALDDAVNAAVKRADRRWTAKLARDRKAAEAAAPVSPAGPVGSDLMVPTAAELRQLVGRR